MKKLSEVLHYYLPYKLRIETYGYFSDYELFPADLREVIQKCNNERWKWKPLLHPLVSLTPEFFTDWNIDITDEIEIREVIDGFRTIDSMHFSTFQLCLEKHLDIFKLIESGQAIEKTNLIN